MNLSNDNEELKSNLESVCEQLQLRRQFLRIIEGLQTT